MDQTMSRKSRSLRVAVAAGIVLTIVMNFLANLLPFFGRSTEEVSDQFFTLVTPAGYVFAIWGLIYIGLLAYAWAQFRAPQTAGTLTDKLAIPLLVSCAANIVWLFLWHGTAIYWSVAVMLILLGSLIYAALLIQAEARSNLTPVEVWGIRAPISLYLGWISVATIANVASALVGAGWDGFGVAPDWWSVMVLIVGAGLAVAAVVRSVDLVYAGVFVWAFVGIGIASPSSVTSVTAYTLAALVTIAMSTRALR